MLVYAPGWTLASQFWSYAPPSKSWFFRGQTNENSPLKSAVSVWFLLKNSGNFFLFFFGGFLRKFCHADLNSREQQAPLLWKMENYRPKLRFSVFRAKFLSPRSNRLSRTTSDASRLIRPHPIDCDKVPEQTVKILSGFAHLFSSIAKKVLFFAPAIY